MNEKEYKWQGLLDEREWSEICFARLYKEQFKHGTDGHNRLLLLAKLSYLLDNEEIANTPNATGKHIWEDQ